MLNRRPWTCGGKNLTHERPHEALGMKCPGEVYRSRQRSYKGSPEDLEYQGLHVRRVGPQGRIMVGKTCLLFITSSLAGWSVGLKSMADGRLEMSFLAACCWAGLIRRLESFLRADIRPQEAGQRKPNV